MTSNESLYWLLHRTHTTGLLRGGSNFPEMQRKRSFSTQRPSIEGESLPTSHHLHLINFNLASPSFVKALHIPNEAVRSAQSSIADLPQAKQLIKKATANIKSNTASHWNTHLSSLSVQCKLTEAVNPEQESQVWKRIRDGLPTGQLSFILHAASDTLPTPLNLRCWKIQCGAKCSLCGNSRPTVACILNDCPVELEQGRYTWRHYCVLSTITSALRRYIPTETTIYADLPNLRATELPPAQFLHPFWLHRLNQIWSSCTMVTIR